MADEEKPDSVDTEVKESTAPVEEKKEPAGNTYSFNGVDIPKDTADTLIQRGYEAYQEDNKPVEAEKKEEEGTDELTTLKTQQKELQAEVKATRLEIDNQKTYNNMLQQMNILVKNSEFLQENPEEAADIQEQVLLNLHANPRQTIQTAFERVVKKEQTKTQRAISQYTKSKLVDAEKTTTERGSGATQVEQREPMTREDVKKGVARKMLFEQLGIQ